MRPLVNQYPKLNPTERLSLLLQATARRDHTEADRIVATLPQSAVPGGRAAFAKALMDVVAGTTLVTMEVRHATGEIQAYARAAAVMSCAEQYNVG